MIYFGDQSLVQKHLHQDLNTIIKNIKIRQQQHLQLLQYNKSILNKKRNIESTIFINDQINLHNKFLERVLQINSQIIKQEKQILNKYDQASVKFQSVMKLMSRSITRILETNQSYIDKIKIFDQHFYQQFGKMKNTITKLINNKEQINLSHSTKIIIEYAQHKALNQIQKLKKLIKSLEDGQVQKMQYIYKGINPPVQKKEQKVIPPPPIMVVPVQKPQITPIKKEQRSPQKSISKLKQQIKNQQKQKKNKKNFANKLIGMYSTMDLSRKQFMDDLTFSNPHQQYQKLYNQIFSRNKFNYDQIIQFQNKKEEFQQKLKIFKEVMIQESNKIQEVLMIKKPSKSQKKEDTQSTSQLQIIQQEKKNPQVQQSDPKEQVKKGFILRQKIASPRFHKEAQLSQLRITQQGFHHIKFDTANQQIFLRSNRNRLPSIQNKQFANTSLNSDHRYQNTSKPKEQKVQRKNFLMKNIQVGVQNVIMNNQNKNKSQIRPSEKNTPMNTLNNMNFMELTFYGASKKKSHILGDTRTNFAF